jgi:Tol biopolymer transport system component
MGNLNTLTRGLLTMILILSGTLQDKSDVIAHINEPQIVFISNRNGTHQVYAMDLNGNNIHQLVDDGINITDISCSRDGNSLAITGDHPGIKILSLINGNTINLFNKDNSAIYSSPTWSPDGNHIAYTSTQDNGWDIYIVNRDGSNNRRLTSSPHLVEREISWSPNGNQLAFSANDETSTGIYIVNSDGSNQTQLTTNQETDFFPDWSPDGSKIIFASEQQQHFRIYSMSPNGSGLIAVTTASHFEDWRPKWSPDGSMIGFNSSRNGNPEIYVMDNNGSHIRRLTNNPASDYIACWLTSPEVSTITPTPALTPSPKPQRP